MNKKAQGALTYLLLIGGAVLVAAIVISLVTGIPSEDFTSGLGCNYNKTYDSCTNASCTPIQQDGSAATNQTEFFLCSGSGGGGPAAMASYEITGADVCSSQYNSTYACNNASNGITTDHWLGTNADPQKWTYGDLGSVKHISAVRIFIYSSYTPQTMNIDVSDDAVSWTNVVTGWTVDIGQGLTWVEKTFTETTGRYVRISMTSCRYIYCNIMEYEVKTR